MYTKSNRKSGSANSLAWFPPYFCFRFRLQGLPNAIFRRFSTFRRRLARVVKRSMLGVPFLGTLPVGVTPPPTTPTTPSVKEYQTRLRALGNTPGIFRLSLTIHFRKFLELQNADFRKILNVSRGTGPNQIATFCVSDFEGEGAKKIFDLQNLRPHIFGGLDFHSPQGPCEPLLASQISRPHSLKQGT